MLEHHDGNADGYAGHGAWPPPQPAARATPAAAPPRSTAHVPARPPVQAEYVVAWLRLSPGLRSLSSVLLLLAGAALLMPALAGTGALPSAVGGWLVASAAASLVQFYHAMRVQFGAELVWARLQAMEQAVPPLDMTLHQLGLLPALPSPGTFALCWTRVRAQLKWQMAWLAVQSAALVAALVQVAGLAA